MIDLATKYTVLGYVTDVDFVASADDAGNVQIVWLSAKDQPSQQQLDAVNESYLSVLKYAKPFKVGAPKT